VTNDFDAGFASIAERLLRSTVQVYADDRGGGSGIVWNDSGAVITNAHVVGSARHVWIESHDGRKIRGEVSLRDERLDLAEVTLNSPAVDTIGASVGRASDLRVGDLVAALGAPLGMAGALTIGIVHRAVADSNGARSRWLEADLRLAPGNSGGPMVDARGKVVGINSMIAGGLALAIPSETAERFVQTRGARAWLGITTQPVAVTDAAKSGANRQRGPALGFVIVELSAGSPAHRAGLALGDVILGINGARFEQLEALGIALDRIAPGDRIDIGTMRGREHRTISVVTGKLTAQVERAA
jgi:serine protease Do